MLTAQRKFSLGSEALNRGDAISAELQASLPPGRLETLKAQRYIEEVTSETVLSRAVDDLERRIERLEKPRRGRPPKEQ